MLPRFSEENFPKNLVVTDKIKAIADKYGANPSQVTLAWIIAEHDTSKSSRCTVYLGIAAHSFFFLLFSLYLIVIPIPGCRTVERIEENAKGAELTLSAEDVKAIRKLSEDADVQGLRYPAAFMATVEGECLPLEQWKGE